MALHVPEHAQSEQILSGINTTPLVDVMLVLLIIFLITVPVVRHPTRVNLPRQQALHQPRPADVVISVTRDGSLYWNDSPLAGDAQMTARLRELAARKAHPRVQISADRAGSYAPVGRVVDACRKAGISSLGFLTKPRAPTP